MDQRITSAAPHRTHASENLPVPRHGSYRGLGVGGFHRLHYCDWGQRDNPRIVICVHGYSRHARDFDVLARALSADFRVICPDLAGRGESDWLGTAMEYSFPQMLADLNALLSRLDVTEVDWVGTSLGGLLGMFLAAQPGTPIRRLVMNDVGAFVPSDSLRQIGRHLNAPVRFNSLADVEAHLRAAYDESGVMTDDQWRQLTLHSARPDGDGYRLHYDPDLATLAGSLPPLPSLYFWDVWNKVTCPTLLLRGEHSTVFPQSVAEWMQIEHDGAQLVEIPGCGHAPLLMSPMEIDVIARFVGADTAVHAADAEALQTA
jgi:pimeloyl-ACP methyl ester carboxylesterase